jgi:hypothetical protein
MGCANSSQLRRNRLRELSATADMIETVVIVNNTPSRHALKPLIQKEKKEKLKSPSSPTAALGKKRVRFLDEDTDTTGFEGPSSKTRLSSPPASIIQGPSNPSHFKFMVRQQTGLLPADKESDAPKLVRRATGLGYIVPFKQPSFAEVPCSPTAQEASVSEVEVTSLAAISVEPGSSAGHFSLESRTANDDVMPFNQVSPTESIGQLPSLPALVSRHSLEDQLLG